MIDDPEIPPVGIIPLGNSRARWRVWAPKAERVELVLGAGESARRLPMDAEPRGFFGIDAELPEPGLRYAYSLDGGPPLPDPVSRWQPDGIDTPSAAEFPERFRWNEGDWRGIARQDLVFYELHVGTFTTEGTFEAALGRVGELRELGITAIELMPVGQFPGRNSWGYDGVLPFAPQNNYGGPEGLHRFVEGCHRLRMAVFLDVVYNHFGPEGNVFPLFGHYFTETYKTDWGPALNFDAPHCGPARAMVLENARMWVRDYRFDGLRLDAADQIYDRSPSPILAEITQAVHAEAAKLGRPAHVFAENDMNDARRFLADPTQGGFGLDGQWNDDFHHAAHVVLTGETNGYYADFAGGPAALAKVYGQVFVNNGNYSPFRERRHGAPGTDFAGDRFLAFTQNHDQVGNRMRSDRYAASLPASAVRLAAGLLLLAPRLPMLLMGEEYGETNPFPFFCDFLDPELKEAVRKGRAGEFSRFGWEEQPPDPLASSTRDSAVLTWSWADPIRAGLRLLYRDLLRLRRETPAMRDFRHPRVTLREGDVLEVIRGEGAEALRILFNLTAEERPAAIGANSFRSEVPTYGSLITEAAPDRLAPHEFAFEAAG